MKKTHLLLIAALVFAATQVNATTVIPPTFEQLVDQAETIFQGKVTKVESQWVGEGAERHIMSYVTFDVQESLKGKPGRQFNMRMFGGTVDGETMAVADAPTFAVGDEDILFVENNGSQFVPLVGIMHGRFHIRHDDAGRETVTSNGDEPVTNVARFGRETSAGPSTEAAMTPASFKAAIRNRLAGSSAQ